jgi:hypothetical protein
VANKKLSCGWCAGRRAVAACCMLLVVLLVVVGCTKTAKTDSDGEAGAGPVETAQGGDGGDQAGGSRSPSDLGCQPIEVQPRGSDDATLEAGESRCYRFKVVDNGLLTVALQGDDGNIRAAVYAEPEGSTLMDPNLGYVGATPGGSTAKIPLPPGTYFIKVWNGTGVYKLETSFEEFGEPLPEVEPGADTKTAEELGPLSASRAVGGYVGATLDPFDIYSFTVADNGVLTITLTGDDGNLRAAVYAEPEGSTLMDPNLGYVGATPGGSTAKITLAPGTYFIKVWNGTGVYKLETSFAPPA